MYQKFFLYTDQFLCIYNFYVGFIKFSNYKSLFKNIVYELF